MGGVGGKFCLARILFLSPRGVWIIFRPCTNISFEFFVLHEFVFCFYPILLPHHFSNGRLIIYFSDFSFPISDVIPILLWRHSTSTQALSVKFVSHARRRFSLRFVKQASVVKELEGWQMSSYFGLDSLQMSAKR